MSRLRTHDQCFEAGRQAAKQLPPMSDATVARLVTLLAPFVQDRKKEAS